MTGNVPDLVFIGFGEAGGAFAAAMPGRVAGFDRKTLDPATRTAKLADFARHGAACMPSNAAAVRAAPLIVSAVTADQALAAAIETARDIAPGALFCDMNSVAPATKRAARDSIEAAGGRYADVAVMAPVHPAGLRTPLLLAGPHAADAAHALRRAGFADARVVDGPVGAASSIKMIRSVMVKGLEALTAECFVAAHAAGVTGEVRASLNAGWPGTDWAAKADYGLERMMVHGLRRAAEMEEVVATLDSLGAGAAMSRGTVERQRAIGSLGLAVPDGLAAKIDLLLKRRAQAA